MFMIAKLESLFCPIVFRSHVFKRRKEENDRSEQEDTGTRKYSLKSWEKLKDHIELITELAEQWDLVGEQIHAA